MRQKKRQARNSHFSNQSLLVPFDCLDFGDPEKDPCFGKLYDLMDDTCLTCGDIEWCATIFNQRVINKRLQAEKEGSNYDLKIDRLEFEKEVRDEYKKLRTNHYKHTRALSKIAKRHQTKLERIKQIVNGS